MEPSSFALEFEKPLQELQKQLDQLRQQSQETNLDVGAEIHSIEGKIDATQKDIYANLTAWQKVQVARHPARPYAADYIKLLFTDFQELHGDRTFSDDQALIGGPAFLDGEAVMIIAQQKGRETKEKIARNFGMPQPEGYRKALRLMKLAAKFRLPVITFINTPGAYPGVGAEARHVAEAIAVNLREMAMLSVPSIAVIIGEGGSGGALGIGVANRVLILEHSYYSVISPEGCAAILWKDSAEAPRAAEALKLSAQHLASFGVVDEVIAEPVGGAHTNPEQASAALKYSIQKHLNDLRALSKTELIDQRHARYRALGKHG